MSEYIIDAFEFADGPVPPLQSILATNIFTSTSNHIGGTAPITRNVGIGLGNGKLMSTADGSGTLIYSENGGDTWVTKSSPEPNNTSTIEYYEPTNTWYITNGNYNSRVMHIYYSTDDGDSWTILDSPHIKSYNWSVGIAPNGDVIHAGRQYYNWIAMSVYLDPPNTTPRNDFTVPGDNNGNGFHAMASGGYYFANQTHHSSVLVYDTANQTFEYGSGSNVAGQGWATDGSGLILASVQLDNQSETVEIARMTGDVSAPWPTDSFVFPHRIRTSTAAYGNGVWLVAGSGYYSQDYRKIHIFMSKSGDPGSFLYEIALEITADRGPIGFNVNPPEYAKCIEIRYYKGNTWIISYIDTASKHRIDTFEFIPTTW